MAPDQTPKHKAVAINIMFTANKATCKYYKDHDSDAHQKGFLLKQAPLAASELLKKRYHVEMPDFTVKRYLRDIQENARQSAIEWDQDNVAKHIGSLIGSLSEDPNEIEKQFTEVASIFKKHHDNKTTQKNPEKLSKETVWLLREAFSVSMDEEIAAKIALKTSWERKGKITSSDISDPALNYEAPENPSSESSPDQTVKREMSDSPPEAGTDLKPTIP